LYKSIIIIWQVGYHVKVNCFANAFLKLVYIYSRGMVCKLLKSFFGKINFSEKKTRIKIIQKVLRVFQYQHLIKEELEDTKNQDPYIEGQTTQSSG
jgi:hypothetical protein